jgi:hypothetical protein
MDKIFGYSQTLDAVFAIVTAILLYLCRSKWKVCYGLIEILAGLYLLSLSINTTKSGFVFGVSAFGSPFETLHIAVVATSYLGSIFVMVRGFDNILSGWPCGGSNS